MNSEEVNVPADEVMVVFMFWPMRANEVNGSSNITISIFLQSLHLTCYLLYIVHTSTNFNTIDYYFVDLENLNNIFINFVVNRT